MHIAECDKDVAEWLESNLLSSLRSRNLQAENSDIVLGARESRDKQLIGGLVARTSYGWLMVHVLWIEENSRRSGVGRYLMKHAELSACALGCHGAWLDTSSKDAHEFYTKLGYETFGELYNNDDQKPTGHKRWFMKKTLQR